MVFTGSLPPRCPSEQSLQLSFDPLPGAVSASPWTPVLMRHPLYGLWSLLSLCLLSFPFDKDVSGRSYPGTARESAILSSEFSVYSAA